MRVIAHVDSHGQENKIWSQPKILPRLDHSPSESQGLRLAHRIPKAAVRLARPRTPSYELAVAHWICEKLKQLKAARFFTRLQLWEGGEGQPR